MYAVSKRWDEIVAITKSYWKKGYNLTHLDYGYGQWFTLFTKGGKQTSQSFSTVDDFDDFNTIIKRQWAKGYRVTNLADGRDLN